MKLAIHILDGHGNMVTGRDVLLTCRRDGSLIAHPEVHFDVDEDEYLLSVFLCRLEKRRVPRFVRYA